ncbi:MAG: hypothetical protein HF973_14535 [Chloroflexi bacterium]|nr:hypothetical protein [Chloroflexota bacterium]
MKRQLTIQIILIGIFVFVLAACAPSTVTTDEEPLYLPAEEEEIKATAVPLSPDDLPAVTRESADNLGPATVVPEAVISQPEGEIMTPPPPGDPARKPTEDEFVQMAKEDLSQQLDISPEEIELVNYEEVQWRDSSLGCPQPKMQYLQVITPGYRIQLSVQGEIYNYHGAADREPFLCALKLGGKDIPVPPPPNMDE